MSRKKKTPDAQPAPVADAVESSSCRRLILLAGLVLAITAGAAIWIWQTVRGQVLSRPEYRLDAAAIEVTPQPPWIRSNVKTEALKSASLTLPTSILEERLVERIAQAFELHPWVEAAKVRKHHPARITVELTYRKPAAMVETGGSVQPVDAAGVVLPKEDFSPVEARRYPRITGISSSPRSASGTPWGDDRVAAGAATAQALADAWEGLKLGQITVESGTPPTVTLHTQKGTTIRWGAPPGSEAKSEPAATDKVKRLQAHFARHGSLDAVPLDLARGE